MAPAAKPVRFTYVVSQSDFDELVRENLDEWDMGEGEAVEEAVKALESQGGDCSTCVKKVGGLVNIGSHEICECARELVHNEDSSGVTRLSSSSCLEKFVAAVSREQDPGTAAAAIQSSRVVVALAGALERACGAEGDANGESIEGSPCSVDEILDAIRVVVSVGRIVQEDFADHRAAAILPMTLHSFVSSQGEEDGETTRCASAGRACRAIVAWCKGFEAGKVLLVAQDAHIAMIKCAEKINSSARLSASGAPTATRTLCYICDAMRALCTGDDVEVAASKAFTHSRLMGEAGAHHELVRSLKLLVRSSSVEVHDVSAASKGGKAEANPFPCVCNALKAVGANDEICQEIAADGAIELLSSSLATSARGEAGGHHPGGLATSRAAFGLLRQLAKSDCNKSRVIEQEGIMSCLHRCLSTGCTGEDDDDDDEASKGSGDEIDGPHTGRLQQVALVREQAIGMLVSLSLRNPEAAVKFCDDGVIAAVLESMRLHRGHSGVQRQGCMTIRNCVVRCPELRPSVLGMGAEKVIRHARRRWPEQCNDVGAAALRDLGLENYNEL